MNELALHVMDILQNSIKAGASCVYILIRIDDKNEFLNIMISDNGCGMDEETMKRALDPFYTSRDTRHVGLGLPLFKEAAIAAEGDFQIESELGKGTSVSVSLKVTSIDRQPLGDIGNVVFLTMLSYEKLTLKLELSCREKNVLFDSEEFAKQFNENCDGEINAMDAAFEAQDYINEQLLCIFGGVLPELGGELL